jgi:hypothetical protein
VAVSLEGLFGSFFYVAEGSADSYLSLFLQPVENIGKVNWHLHVGAEINYIFYVNEDCDLIYIVHISSNVKDKLPTTLTIKIFVGEFSGSACQMRPLK